jgi:hypothetical protein
MSNKKKLDVDFEVIEEPEDVLFPRLPNVVSHRGHKVKIVAIIRDVPAQPMTISLRARVLVLDRETIGEKEHISRPAKIWGEAKEVTATFPSNDFLSLPFMIEAIVPRSLTDDHLGEGPHYQALVNVTASSDDGELAIEDTSGSKEGSKADDQSASDSGFDGDGLYIIEFMSK